MFEEVCRANALQPHVLRRFQRLLRDEIQPMLDEREQLLEDTASLREQLAQALRAQAPPEKRKRGRPRKVQPEAVSA